MKINQLNIISQLEETYSFQVLNCARMKSGYNYVYKLKTNKGLKVLKISDKTKEHVKFDQDFIKSLIDADFTHVPLPVPIKKPTRIDEVIDDTIAIIGDRAYLLFEWIDGDDYNGNFEQIISAGENLSKFHHLSGEILQHRLKEGETDYGSIRSSWGDLVVRFPPIGKGKTIQGDDIWSNHVRQNFNHKQLRTPNVHYEWSQKDNSMVAEFVRNCTPFVEKKLVQIKKSLYEMGFRCEQIEQDIMYCFPVPKAIVHADYAPQNLKFNHNKICAMLDFDNANARERMYDVSWGLATFCTEKNGEMNLRKIEAFIRGYVSASPLSEIELKIIPYEIYTRCFETMYWPAEKYINNKPWRLDFAEHDYHITKWLNKHEQLVLNCIYKAARI